MTRLPASAALFLAGTGPALAGDLFVYAVPPTLQYSAHNDDFTVQARVAGGAWKDLYEWNVRVDHDKPQDASLVYFDFTGSVEIRIQKNQGLFSKVTVGPKEDAPRPVLRDGKVYLTLDRPRNFAVFFDDDRLHNLHIFAGAPVSPPAVGEVRRFGPGLHVPEAGGGVFDVKSGETVFLEGGAVMMGTFRIMGADNVRIAGHGLILPPAGGKGQQLLVEKSKNVTIEGPIIIQADSGVARTVMSTDVRITDLKGISGGQWTDGINIYSSERVSLDRLFLRTSDDCVTVYAHRNEIYGDARDIKVTNSTLWADVAHAMFVGLHGNSVQPETIERITFDNIDVVNLDEDDPDYEGVFSIVAGDSNLVQDVTFSNIRVDRIEEGKLFQFRVAYNQKYNTSAGRGIRRVMLRNIHYSGEGMASPSLIAGFDATHGVQDVLLDHVTIGGRALSLSNPDDIAIGPFTTAVRTAR